MDQMGKLRPNFEPTNSTKSKQETRVAEPGGFDPDPDPTLKKIGSGSEPLKIMRIRPKEIQH